MKTIDLTKPLKNAKANQYRNIILALENLLVQLGGIGFVHENIVFGWLKYFDDRMKKELRKRK